MRAPVSRVAANNRADGRIPGKTADTAATSKAKSQVTNGTKQQAALGAAGVVKTFSDTHITEPIRELINRATPAATQDKLCK
jgi:hypothetical protein